ncbi:mucin-2 isoform X2 [Onychostoma macrolepis]|uniref:mucin-2 isoform X2 n=1 Tax=Onychostoma macrolepis TaxID=369639 RepID=UPI00272BD38B|nr:mucin-2 isoform X2 [Onychostoma macrolepis]
MGSDQFKFLNKIICALCEKSDETEITGPLSSKGNISAHQNCLLFASGIYCKNSPTYDDLFGFDVDDVKKELKRGKRLLCHHCKKNGATAGCDVKRCKRSYHYPCAIEDRGRALEDRFILFCKLHDPESPQKSLPDGRRPNMKRPDRRDSDSSTGSSEVSLPKKKKNSCFLDSDEEIEYMYAPVQSDIEDCTPPNQNNPSTPDPESKRPCAEPSPSTTGSLNLTSAQKACGSADNPGESRGRSKYYPYMYRACTFRSLKVGTLRKGKNKTNLDSDDESPTSTDLVVAPGVSDLEDSVLQKQPSWSTPVPKKTRLCEKLNPSTTADDDTDIDSEESQSLLPLKPYRITIPCSVILDSGPSAESEHSLEPSSPVGAAPAAVSTSSGSVTAPEHKETPSTNRTSPPPTAPSTEPVSPGTIYSMATLDYFTCDPSGQAGSPQHSSPTVDVPELLISSVQTISASRFKSEQLPVTPPAGVSSSPGRPTAADASGVGTTVSSKCATIFWTRCNEAGWTKEIFSELVSQLSSLGERVQSQKASHQDYDVALKVLGASGRLPCIITQLQQDLEKQEQDLQKKKAALRDAKAVLDV